MKWNLMENAISFSDRVKMIKFILSSDRYTNGEKVRELESSWSTWIGSKHSLFTSSGSTANFLLIASIKEYYGLKQGDKVLIPACTWMTNVAPIIQLGLTPIFCDIQFSDFSFDHKELKYISKIHPDIKLAFVTHLLGYSSTSSEIISKYFPMALIIDDVCESHGCKSVDGSKVGSNSIGATYSTYFGHHLTTIEGGFVSTNNEELFDIMKMKRSHGFARESIRFQEYANRYKDIDPSFLFITDGYNFRNNELAAVLGLSQLSKLDKSIEIRNANHKIFAELIEEYQNLFHKVSFVDTMSSFCLPFICKRKETSTKLKQLLTLNGVEYRPIVSGNLLKQPFLREYSLCTNKKKTNIDELHNNGLYIGNNQFVTKKHFKFLKKILNEL